MVTSWFFATGKILNTEVSFKHMWCVSVKWFNQFLFGSLQKKKLAQLKLYIDQFVSLETLEKHVSLLARVFLAMSKRENSCSETAIATLRTQPS